MEPCSLLFSISANLVPPYQSSMLSLLSPVLEREELAMDSGIVVLLFTSDCSFWVEQCRLPMMSSPCFRLLPSRRKIWRRRGLVLLTANSIKDLKSPFRKITQLHTLNKCTCAPSSRLPAREPRAVSAPSLVAATSPSGFLAVVWFYSVRRLGLGLPTYTDTQPPTPRLPRNSSQRGRSSTITILAIQDCLDKSVIRRSWLKSTSHIAVAV